MVQVEILPASRTQSAPAAVASEFRKPSSEATPTPTIHAKASRNPAYTETTAAAKTPDVLPAAAAAEAAALSVAQPETAGREKLAVREHLERFKYYPASARRRGITGDVEVGFRLAADGTAEQLLVLASSGYDVLDRAALETVSRAQPFPAAGGQYQFRLRFHRL